MHHHAMEQPVSLVFLLLLLRAAWGLDCSKSCADKFESCIIDEGNTYNVCKSKIEDDDVDYSVAGCFRTCDFTKEMKEMKDSACFPGNETEGNLTNGCYKLGGRPFTVEVPRG